MKNVAWDCTVTSTLLINPSRPYILLFIRSSQKALLGRSESFIFIHHTIYWAELWGSSCQVKVNHCYEKHYPLCFQCQIPKNLKRRCNRNRDLTSILSQWWSHVCTHVAHLFPAVSSSNCSFKSFDSWRRKPFGLNASIPVFRVGEIPWTISQPSLLEKMYTGIQKTKWNGTEISQKDSFYYYG